VILWYNGSVNTLAAKSYLLIADIVFGASLASMIFLLMAVSPESGFVVLLSFYSILFLLVFTTAMLAGYYIRQSLGNREFALQDLHVSARQGLWLAILVTISFVLLALEMFSTMPVALLTLALVFLESYLTLK